MFNGYGVKVGAVYLTYTGGMSTDEIRPVPLGVRRALFAAWVAPWVVLAPATILMVESGVISGDVGMKGLIVWGPPVVVAMVVAMVLNSTLLALLGAQIVRLDYPFLILILILSVPYFVILWSPLGQYYGIWNDRGERGSYRSLALLTLFIVLHLMLGFAFSLYSR